MISHPLAPVFDENSRLLILGSFPSARSREVGFYYGHPQNRFWKMLSELFGEELSSDTAAQKAFLLRRKIALWDVIAECEIIGSSDASIRNAAPNDLTRIFSASPIRRIICNGQTAYKLYRRYYPEPDRIPVFRAPSTSPANAAFTMDKLKSAWTPLLFTETTQED